jgi:ATP-dependent Clp protease ATP-binding subunit ClpA
MNKNYFIVYNQHIDSFVKVKRCDVADIENIFTTLDDHVELSTFRSEDFVSYVVARVICNYDRLERRYSDFSNLNEALYESVSEVYPMLSVESACHHYNAFSEKEEKEPTEDFVPLTLSEIRGVRKKIKNNLIGQDEAVSSVINSLKLQNSGFDPFTSLFFIGPTGVGKTELARQLAKHYLGGESRLLKLNCAEYANPHEYAKLVGSPPGYIGFGEKGILTQKADESSRWVILFDEIEKASSKLHNLLLGFLDDGVITDNQGQELNFKDSIIIFTSNVGIHENVGKKQVGFEKSQKTYAESKEDITDAFKNEFSPEFINRIDHTVYFNELSVKDAEKITRLQLRQLPIKITPRLVKYVVKGGYSSEYGARNIKRFIKTNITLKLADEILSDATKYSIFKPVFSKDGCFTVEGVSSI